MKYQEMLDICKQNNAFGSQFYVAEELECQLIDVREIITTPERFEQLCELAHYCYLQSDNIPILQICEAVAALEEEYIKNNSGDPLEMKKWDILDKATAYLE